MATVVDAQDGQAVEQVIALGPAFLGTLREKYSDAWVFLTIGLMTTDALLTSMRAHLDSVVTRFGDPKVASVPMEPQDAFTTGCDYHPDIGEHERMAGVLAAAMKPKLGW